MNVNELLRKSWSLVMMAMMTVCANAKINMGTINLQVGESQQVFAEPSTYYTVSGNWSRTGGSAFYISARSQRSCTITAINAGTATLEWEGLINATWAEMYWTVNVSGNSGGGSGTGDPTGAPDEPTEKWDTSGNYSITWYNKNKSEFTITTDKELAGLAYLVNNGYSDFSEKTIKIGDDISLSGKSWSSIGKTSEKSFNGTFDGQGHIIGGLFIGKQDDNQLYYGFFGYLGNKSVVKNVVLQGEVNVYNPVYTDTKYTGHHYVGGLAGNCKSRTVENCKCEMLVKYSRSAPSGGNVGEVNVGGLFGWCGDGIIRYCSHEGNVICLQTPTNAGYSDVALPWVGGLIGYYSGSSSGTAILEYCENISNTITLSVPNNSKSSNHLRVGGLFGQGYGKVRFCRNVCNFDITHNGFPYSASILAYIGGIGGQSTATTINCYSAVPKTIINSTRINEVHYSGIGGHSSTSKANYSNSDASIQTSLSLIREYDGSTSFSSAQMQTSAFLDELNTYSIIEGDGAVWTQDEGGYPYIAKLHETSGISNIKMEIKQSDKIYSLSGQRLNAPQKGINIIGGKKVVVK